MFLLSFNIHVSKTLYHSRLFTNKHMEWPSIGLFHMTREGTHFYASSNYTTYYSMQIITCYLHMLMSSTMDMTWENPKMKKEITTMSKWLFIVLYKLFLSCITLAMLVKFVFLSLYTSEEKISAPQSLSAVYVCIFDNC